VAIENGFQGEIQAINDENQALQDAQDAGDSGRSPAEIERRDSIATRAYGVVEDKDLVALDQMLETRISHLTEARERFFGGGTGEANSTFKQLSDDAAKSCETSHDSHCFEKTMNATCRPALSGAHADFAVQLADL